MSTPLSAVDYYDQFPSAEHHPGDIWVDMPTFGVLPQISLPGIVLTPACDLSNRKVESITYLPILPVSSYLTSRSVLPEIKKVVEGQLTAASLGGVLDSPGGYEWPERKDLAATVDLVAAQLRDPKLSQKDRTALTRALRGLRLLTAICVETPPVAEYSDAKSLIGDKGFGELAKKLITNGRPDVHFLPWDEQRREWSGVPAHALALFRYPLTVPIEVLELAQRVGEAEWPKAAQRLRHAMPCVDAFSCRPMKRLRLRPRFMSDLLTRFTAMFGRLGSPDFTAETVARMVTEIEETP